MITAKFGGTAITPANLHFVKEILTPFHNRVVVSAVGKEYAQDVKTTDLLQRYYVTGDEGVWRAIADKYARLAAVNCIPINAEETLDEAHSRARSRDISYCMSLGEELSAKFVAKYLNATYVEADGIVRFNGSKLSFNATVSLMKRAFKGVELAVTGGYYGMGKYGRQTFSRGGSDVTGALCAVASGSSLYENWTDAYGVQTANPALISGVQTIPTMSYDEMYRLSVGGAEVLHPDAVSPVERSGIPIKIGNFFNHRGASTLISNCPSRNELLSVTEKIADGKFITTVLHAMPLSKITQIFSRFFCDNRFCFDCFDRSFSADRVEVYSFEADGSKALLVTDASVIRSLYGYFVRQ